MFDRVSKVVVLCEDRQHDVFVRHFLIGMGCHPKRLRVVLPPVGVGAGEQFVRENYPLQVKAYRSQCNRLNIRLVVLIDADVSTVPEREQQLDTALKDQGLPERSAKEKIGVFVPKRNIETWIAHLESGSPVDESKAYPKRNKETECIPGVKALVERCRNHLPLPDQAPDSLKRACAEFRERT